MVRPTVWFCKHRHGNLSVGDLVKKIRSIEKNCLSNKAVILKISNEFFGDLKHCQSFMSKHKAI